MLCDFAFNLFETLLYQGEVNAIKWDPTGSLLASCSDDSTAKIDNSGGGLNRRDIHHQMESYRAWNKQPQSAISTGKREMAEPRTSVLKTGPVSEPGNGSGGWVTGSTVGSNRNETVTP
ncbi:hypothetical protein HYC85_020572 [Camellia sinensis]|uniref:Uncharacterized protein n=1 Tax=Camellia sinensis TaxID=4442 RepID=A0A7J7GQG1_CAMSI|nr:hypothetical protein HYC85_020572 [Camellia sinensis]